MTDPLKAKWKKLYLPKHSTDPATLFWRAVVGPYMLHVRPALGLAYLSEARYLNGLPEAGACLWTHEFPTPCDHITLMRAAEAELSGRALQAAHTLDWAPLWFSREIPALHEVPRDPRPDQPPNDPIPKHQREQFATDARKIFGGLLNIVPHLHLMQMFACMGCRRLSMPLPPDVTFVCGCGASPGNLVRLYRP